MRGGTVARTYAEALYEVALGEGDLEGYGAGIETVARLLDEHPDFRVLLETPRVTLAEKKEVVRRTFASVVPRKLLSFLLLTLDKRRQRLLREISIAFHDIVDERLGRVHVQVTLAREMDPEVVERLAASLSVLLGRTAIPHLRIKPEILGGVVVKAGDNVYDGSLKRRLGDMRRQLLSAGI